MRSRFQRSLTVSLLLLLTQPSSEAFAQKLDESLAANLISQTISGDSLQIRYVAEDDESVARLIPMFEEAKARVESFFGSGFPEEVRITIVPDRENFSAVLRNEWSVPQSACWMVGIGVADFLVILSPRVWSAQACEHDPADPQHIQDIVTHEMTHVYHGQNNPSRDFTGAEEIGWFAEGLAVLVAGQLDRDRLSQPAEAIREGKEPAQLAKAWSGPYRYGVAGSLVSFIDQKKGRNTLLRLLPIKSQKDFLVVIQMEEGDLLTQWKEWVMAN